MFLHISPIASVVPVEILAQGYDAKLLYEEALKDGSVIVYRGRLIFIGQDGAGKTSLKKSLLGLPFDPKEQSTEGIEVEPSICEIEVEQVKNWTPSSDNRPSLSEFSIDVSRIFAEKQYHWVLNKAKEDTEDNLSIEQPKVKSTVELDFEDSHFSLANQVCTFEALGDLQFKSGWDGPRRLNKALKSRRIQ